MARLHEVSPLDALLSLWNLRGRLRIEPGTRHLVTQAY